MSLECLSTTKLMKGKCIRLHQRIGQCFSLKIWKILSRKRKLKAKSFKANRWVKSESPIYNKWLELLLSRIILNRITLLMTSLRCMMFNKLLNRATQSQIRLVNSLNKKKKKLIRKSFNKRKFQKMKMKFNKLFSTEILSLPW